MFFLCNPYHQLSVIKDIVSYSLVLYCWVYIFETVCKIIDGKIYLLTYHLFFKIPSAAVPVLQQLYFIEKRSCCLFWYTMSYKKIEKSDYMQLQVTTSAYELESGWQKGSAGDCELQLVMAGQIMSDYKWLWVTITNGCHT